METSLENKKIGQQLEAAQKNGIEYAITEFQPGHKSYKIRQLSTRQDKEMTLAELYDIMKRLFRGRERLIEPFVHGCLVMNFKRLKYLVPADR